MAINILKGGRLMVLNVSETRKYLLLLWILIASGVWTISVPASLTIFINFALAVSMLIILYQRGVLRKAALLAVFTVLLLCIFLLNFDFLSWMSYAFIICFCIMGMYISSFWHEGEFLNKYTNIMTIIVVVSLVMYILRNFLASHQAGFPVVEGQAVSYTNFYIYLYCRELPNRNCAIFWEPGAFAVFIGVAMYTTLITNKKNKTLKLIVYIVALFTTQSTLAYTIILFTVFMYLVRRNNSTSLFQKVLIGILMTGIVLLAMDEFGVFQNIQEKLFTGLQTNESSRARNIAQLIDLRVISKSPIIGVGFNEYFNQVRAIGTLFGQNWTMAANTFTFMGAIFGIPYMLVTVIGITKVCPRNASIIFKCISSCFWIWLFVTQNFVQKPILYCLVFFGYTASAFESVEVKKNE